MYCLLSILHIGCCSIRRKEDLCFLLVLILHMWNQCLKHNLNSIQHNEAFKGRMSCMNRQFFYMILNWSKIQMNTSHKYCLNQTGYSWDQRVLQLEGYIFLMIKQILSNSSNIIHYFNWKWNSLNQLFYTIYQCQNSIQMNILRKLILKIYYSWDRKLKYRLFQVNKCLTRLPSQGNMKDNLQLLNHKCCNLDLPVDKYCSHLCKILPNMIYIHLGHRKLYNRGFLQ